MKKSLYEIKKLAPAEYNLQTLHSYNLRSRSSKTPGESGVKPIRLRRLRPSHPQAKPHKGEVKPGHEVESLASKPTRVISCGPKTYRFRLNGAEVLSRSSKAPLKSIRFCLNGKEVLSHPSASSPRTGSPRNREECRSASVGNAKKHNIASDRKHSISCQSSLPDVSNFSKKAPLDFPLPNSKLLA